MTIVLGADVYRSEAIIASSVLIGAILQQQSQTLVTIVLGTDVYRSDSIIVSSVFIGTAVKKES